MAHLGKKVVEIAQKENGTAESPRGSNTGPRVRQYQAATWLGGTNWPWCLAYVHWCYRQAGRPITENLGAGSWAFHDERVKAGWGTIAPKPGDIVTWNFGSGHTSLYLSRSGDTVKTIDGNVSDKVAIVTRKKSQVRGYIHVPEKHGKKKRKPVLFEVVTSASGTKQVVFTGRKGKALNFISKNTRRLFRKGGKVRLRRRGPRR
jgi:uncharacterized protein (TIGR02594 family)